MTSPPKMSPLSLARVKGEIAFDTLSLPLPDDISPNANARARDKGDKPPPSATLATHPPIRILAATLAAIAERVARLGPCRRDPERFHADKSDLAAELRALARALETA